MLNMLTVVMTTDIITVVERMECQENRSYYIGEYVLKKNEEIRLNRLWSIYGES